MHAVKAMPCSKDSSAFLLCKHERPVLSELLVRFQSVRILHGRTCHITINNSASGGLYHEHWLNVSHMVCSGGCPMQVSCSWGYTTGGGAKGVGDSTTSAVVISLVLIFIADFFLSFLFFQGQGDALKQLK